MHRCQVSTRAELRPSSTEHDLLCVLTRGWLDLRQLHPDERQLAEQFYEENAVHQQRLASLQRAAQAACEAWTGLRPHPIGSSCNGTALSNSDIDFYLPMPEFCHDLNDLRNLLAGRASYQKARIGPAGENRYLFRYTRDATRIDLNFIPARDFRFVAAVAQELATGLTTDDCIAHTWVKHLLHERRKDDAYREWKTAMRLYASPTLRRLIDARQKI